jgi:hypothetical protein
MLVLVEIRVLCLWWLAKNLLIHFMLILAHGYLLVMLLWSLMRIHFYFCKSWHNDVYNYLNTCLYAL